MDPTTLESNWTLPTEVEHAQTWKLYPCVSTLEKLKYMSTRVRVSECNVSKLKTIQIPKKSRLDHEL